MPLRHGHVISILVILVGALLVKCSPVPLTYKPSEPIPPAEFSHRLFDEVLHAHVKDGWVNYPEIARDARFDAYLDQLGRIDPATLPAKNDRLAFWINAYNALAIKGIVDGGSPATLLGRYDYFIKRRYTVGGRIINLHELEQTVLVKAFGEPRVHFAIVPASRSSPKLRAEAYSAERLPMQLDENARTFINDPERNRFDRARREATLSKIFDWSSDEFIAASGSLVRYVKKYVNDKSLLRELDAEFHTVEFLKYDWDLNGIPPLTKASN
jgi:hypothetical protein